MMQYHMHPGMGNDRSEKPCPNGCCGFIMSIDTVVRKDII